MAFFKTDERTLAIDQWPNRIGYVIQEGEKAVADLTPSELVPCDIRSLPSWLCVERQTELGRAVVIFRSDIKSGEQDAGVQIAVRLQGVISDMNLALGGNWDGTLTNIHKARQHITLVSGGCAAAFAPQEKALMNIRQVVLTMLGKSGFGEHGRQGSILLRKRVFTKVPDTSLEDVEIKPTVVDAAEDPSGQLRQYDATWRIVDRIICGRQDADGTLRPLHVSLLNRGDFVDILATLTVPLTRGSVGTSGDLMVEPKRILRLRTSVQIAASSISHSGCCLSN
uniref:N/A n=1 Tax=Ganoderma boninense TaxID=34458 RepID=A0A5K1K815_9APHY|nr:N/A [Ganoderma boninense]